MPESSTHVRLRFSLFTGSLSLKRTPKYLRFTCSGITSCSRNWDAGVKQEAQRAADKITEFADAAIDALRETKP